MRDLLLRNWLVWIDLDLERREPKVLLVTRAMKTEFIILCDY
jgi:hypothetical protein